MSAHILLVEDETHIAQGLVFNLEAEGYRVTHVETCRAAMALIDNNPPDLVVLDLMLPDGHGLTVCQQIRRKDKQLPILILTAQGSVEDRVQGLREGADDYLAKPFSLDEFLLRVNGMLRRSEWYRSSTKISARYEFGPNQVDLNNLKATTAHGEVNLTDLECRMLATFFRAEGQTLSRSALLTSVWGMAEDAETRTLDNFIVRLRKYFEEDPSNPKHFLTVRGQGYRFVRKPES